MPEQTPATSASVRKTISLTPVVASWADELMEKKGIRQLFGVCRRIDSSRQREGPRVSGRPHGCALSAGTGTKESRFAAPEEKMKAPNAMKTAPLILIFFLSVSAYGAPRAGEEKTSKFFVETNIPIANFEFEGKIYTNASVVKASLVEA